MKQSEQSQLEHSLDALGAGPNHDWDDIEKQYRQLVQRWHPDRNANDVTDTAKNKFIEINSAYKYLRSHYLKRSSSSHIITGSNRHHIPPQQPGPLFGTKKQTLIKPAFYKNKFVIASTVSIMIAVLFGALLWSLDSRLTKNNRDRASIEEMGPN